MSPIARLRRFTRGRCPTCGRLTLFAAFTENVRESGRCLRCGASNRQRQLAHVVRRVHAAEDTGPLLDGRTLDLYNAEANGPLHRALRAHAGYVCSEYLGPERIPGTIVDGMRHEDLQALSFADERFDLVLTSDVLEHLPDPDRAQREILRVLKPGGRHCFTVPFDGTLDGDDVRARLVGDRIEYLAEPLHHHDPTRPGCGILVWRIFGRDMLVRLASIGFEVRLHELDAPTLGIVGPGAVVFEARKPL